MSEKDKTLSPRSDVSGAAAADHSANPGTIPLDLDVEALLVPIEGDRPTGSDLRYEGTYDSIQDARREEDAALPQGIWERDLKRADWPEVKRLCVDALDRRSKDIQLAVWLMEALIPLHGFDGARAGLKLLTGLVEKYWDDLLPSIEDDDLDGRVAPLVWMNEKLSLKLKLVPITRPRSMDARPYCFADWETANRLEKLAVKDKHAVANAEAEGKVTRAKFLGSVMFTPGTYYARQDAVLSASLALLETLNSLSDEKCGRAAPSLNLFRQTLESVQGLVRSFLKEKQAEMPQTPIEATAQADVDAIGAALPLSTLAIHSREEAYAILSAAADYLFIHEPHSPTPHLIRRAVTWGRMPLSDLLRELIGDDDSNLRQIFKLLGIRYNPEP
ncbi:MAG: type VI secretion system protein TssA [Desulfobacterales bacterium]|nr:type VI secretion system protein TssA [Desulfobacterales bacterium]